MTEQPSRKEIIAAADEAIVLYGPRAALVVADLANGARDSGEAAKYEFWQQVCININERIYQKARVQEQVAAGEVLMDRYRVVLSALAK